MFNPDVNKKPEFDPSKEYKPAVKTSSAAKPAFNPSKSFEPVKKKEAGAVDSGTGTGVTESMLPLEEKKPEINPALNDLSPESLKNKELENNVSDLQGKSFLDHDIDNHLTGLLNNPEVNKPKDKYSIRNLRYNQQQIEYDESREGAKNQIKSSPEDMKAYAQSRVADINRDIDKTKSDLKGLTTATGYGATGFTDEIKSLYDDISMATQYKNSLKSSIAAEAARIITPKHLENMATFNPRQLGREILSVADPEQEKLYQDAEYGGKTLPGIQNAYLEKMGISAAKSYLLSNPTDSPEWKQKLGTITDQEQSFDDKNFELTGQIVREKLAAKIYNEGKSAWFGFGYNEKTLKQAAEDPSTGLTASEKKVFYDYVLPIEKKVIGTQIPTSGFTKSLQSAIEKSVLGTVNTTRGLLGFRDDQERATEVLNQEIEQSKFRMPGQSNIIRSQLNDLLEKEKSGKLDATEEKQKVELQKYLDVRNNWSKFKDGTGDLTGQVLQMALLTKGVGAAGRALSLFGESGGLLTGGFTTSTFGTVLSNETVGLTVNGFLTSYDNYRQQALQMMPGKENAANREAYATTMGIVEGLSERIFNDTKVLNAFTKKVAPTIRNITTKLINQEITRDVAKQEFQSALKNYLKPFAKSFATSEVEESTEEGVVDLADGISQSVFGGQPFDLIKTGKQALNTFLTTALYSPLVSGMAAHGAYRQNNSQNAFLKSALVDMGKNPSAYLSSVEDLQLNGVITQGEANEKIRLTKSAANYLGELPQKRSDGQDFDYPQTSTYLLHRLNEGLLQHEIDNTTDDVVLSKLNKDLKRSQEIRKGIFNNTIGVTPDMMEVSGDPKEAEGLGIADATQVNPSELIGTPFENMHPEHSLETEGELQKEISVDKTKEAADFIHELAQENLIPDTYKEQAISNPLTFLQSVADQALGYERNSDGERVKSKSEAPDLTDTYTPAVVNFATKLFPEDNAENLKDESSSSGIDEFRQSINSKTLREILNNVDGESGKTASEKATGAKTRLAGDYLYHQDRGAFDALLDDIVNGRNESDWHKYYEYYQKQNTNEESAGSTEKGANQNTEGAEQAKASAETGATDGTTQETKSPEEQIAALPVVKYYDAVYGSTEGMVPEVKKTFKEKQKLLQSNPVAFFEAEIARKDYKGNDFYSDQHKKDFQKTIDQIKSIQDASTIRSDQGQPGKEGLQNEGSQNEGSKDIQREGGERSDNGDTAPGLRETQGENEKEVKKAEAEKKPTDDKSLKEKGKELAEKIRSIKLNSDKNILELSRRGRYKVRKNSSAKTFNLKEKLIELGAPQSVISKISPDVLAKPLTEHSYAKGERIERLGGFFDLRDPDTIYYDAAQKEENFKWVFTHESIHYLTAYAIHNYEEGNYDILSKEGIKNLEYIQSVYDKVVSESPLKREKKFYGLTNLSEFVAEFISNDWFRNYVGSKFENRTVLQKVFDAIRSFVSSITGIDVTRRFDVAELDNINAAIEALYTTPISINIDKSVAIPEQFEKLITPDALKNKSVAQLRFEYSKFSERLSIKYNEQIDIINKFATSYDKKSEERSRQAFKSIESIAAERKHINGLLMDAIETFGIDKLQERYPALTEEDRNAFKAEMFVELLNILKRDVNDAKGIQEFVNDEAAKFVNDEAAGNLNTEKVDNVLAISEESEKNGDTIVNDFINSAFRSGKSYFSIRKSLLNNGINSQHADAFLDNYFKNLSQEAIQAAIGKQEIKGLVKVSAQDAINSTEGTLEFMKEASEQIFGKVHRGINEKALKAYGSSISDLAMKMFPENEMDQIDDVWVKKGIELAAKLRNIKLRPRGLQANIFAIPLGIYNGLVETIATLVENGVPLSDAITSVVKDVRINDFDEDGFRRAIMDISEGRKPKLKAQLTEEDYESRTPQEAQANSIDDYQMTTTGLVDKFMSGKTIEDVFGDVPEGEQNYEVQSLSDMLQDGRNMIAVAQRNWGNDVMDYGKALFGYIQDMSADKELTNKKAVLMATFLGELKEAMVREPERKNEIQPLYNVMEDYYQHYMNLRGKEVVAGRLLRLYRDKYVGDIFMNRILDQKLAKARRSIQDAERSTKISDEIAQQEIKFTPEEKRDQDESAKKRSVEDKKSKSTKKRISKSEAQQKAKQKLDDINKQSDGKQGLIDKIKEAINKLNCK